MTQRHPSPAPSVPSAVPDWGMVRARAARFPAPAFEFVRDGLAYTLAQRAAAAKSVEPVIEVPASEALIASPPRGDLAVVGRHISGQELCDGLRNMARERYGPLALTVLHSWGVRSTLDFGVMVYALIDKGEMRASPGDRFDDFDSRYDFAAAFKT